MTKLNKDDAFVERRNVGESPTTAGNGMYKLAFWYYFLITLYFVYEVPQIGVLAQAHDFQMNDCVFNAANTVSIWLV